MSIDRNQMRSLVVRSLARRKIGGESIGGRAAENLVLGVFAQESGMGSYLRQMGNGPALGFGQMEPKTYQWLHDKFIPRIGELHKYVFPMLEWDIDHMILMTRLFFRAFPDPLPAEHDIAGMAELWKRRYNTIHGKGTEAQFIDNYKRFVIET